MRGTALDPNPGFDEANRVQRFWTENYAELSARFPDRFVAVSRATNEVVATNKDLTLLVDGLRDKGFDPQTDVSIDFVAAGERNLFL